MYFNLKTKSVLFTFIIISTFVPLIGTSGAVVKTGELAKSDFTVPQSVLGSAIIPSECEKARQMQLDAISEEVNLILAKGDNLTQADAIKLQSLMNSRSNLVDTCQTTITPRPPIDIHK